MCKELKYILWIVYWLHLRSDIEGMRVEYCMLKNGWVKKRTIVKWSSLYHPLGQEIELLLYSKSHL